MKTIRFHDWYSHHASQLEKTELDGPFEQRLNVLSNHPHMLSGVWNALQLEKDEVWEQIGQRQIPSKMMRVSERAEGTVFLLSQRGNEHAGLSPMRQSRP